MFESIIGNSWNNSVIQVLLAGFGTKRRHLPPKSRKLPPKRCKSKQQKYPVIQVRYLKGSFISMTITVCIMSWVHTEQVINKMDPKIDSCERLEYYMLKTESLRTPFKRSNNASHVFKTKLWEMKK